MIFVDQTSLQREMLMIFVDQTSLDSSARDVVIVLAAVKVGGPSANVHLLFNMLQIGQKLPLHLTLSLVETLDDAHQVILHQTLHRTIATGMATCLLYTSPSPRDS